MKHLIAFMASNKIASRIVLRLFSITTSFSIGQFKKERKKGKEKPTKTLEIYSIYP